MGKTSNQKLLKYILCLLVFSLTNTLYGQLNLKVGYNLGYSDLAQTESIFERFNDNNPQAEKKLSAVNFYNGIELGLRYRFDNFGIDVGISSMSGNAEALNVFQNDGSLGKDDWKISLLNYSLGLENYFGTFGFGATIGTQKLKYKTNFTSSDGTRTVFDESVLTSKFYLIIEVPSNKVAFSIRPYISTTWQPYNIKDIELIFDPQSTRPNSAFDQDLIVYGFSFLFYNGPQNR